MNKNLTSKIKSLPQNPGVYLFKDKTGRILYIGKAIKLKNRVKSHFSKTSSIYKGNLIQNINDIDYIKVIDEKEALILENDFIKKYQPRYNVQWRDDKSYLWINFSNDEWPRVQIAHQLKTSPSTALGVKNYKLKTTPIGPFVNGRELRQVLRALRKILPYRTCKNPYDRPCLQWHLGLCPAHSDKLLKSGFKNSPRSDFSDALNTYLFSLSALRQFLRLYAGESIRLEAYDISNIQGTNATGSMIVFDGAKPKKSDYRRFRIKTVHGANDAAMLKEVLRRRLGHKEWPVPDLMLIDGGRGQLNAVHLMIKNHKLKANPIALAKRDEELYTIYSNRVLRLNVLPVSFRLIFQSVRNEAHRFAITYYRKLHRKKLSNQ